MLLTQFIHLLLDDGVRPLYFVHAWSFQYNSHLYDIYIFNRDESELKK